MTRHIHAHLFICLLALIGCSKSQDSDNTESKKTPTQSNTNIVASIAVINLDTVAIELGATSLVENSSTKKKKTSTRKFSCCAMGTKMNWKKWNNVSVPTQQPNNWLN